MIDVDGFVVDRVLDCLVKVVGKAFLFELQRLFCSLPFGFACKIVSIYLVVDVVDVLDCLILNVWNIVLATPTYAVASAFYFTPLLLEHLVELFLLKPRIFNLKLLPCSASPTLVICQSRSG